MLSASRSESPIGVELMRKRGRQDHSRRDTPPCGPFCPVRMPGIAQPPHAANGHFGPVAAPVVLSLVRELHPFAIEGLLAAIAARHAASGPHRRRTSLRSGCRATGPGSPDGAACRGALVSEPRVPTHPTRDTYGSNPPRFAVARPRRANGWTMPLVTVAGPETPDPMRPRSLHGRPAVTVRGGPRPGQSLSKEISRVMRAPTEAPIGSSTPGSTGRSTRSSMIASVPSVVWLI